MVNHSERVCTRPAPCGKGTLSRVYGYITEFMPNSLKLDMKVTVSCHEAHRTVHITYREAMPQGHALAPCHSSQHRGREAPHKQVTASSGTPSAEAISGERNTEEGLDSFP